MQDEHLEIDEGRVRGLLDTIAAGYQPPASDLVPEALTAARRATRRRAIAGTFGVGVLAAAGSLAVALSGSGTAGAAPAAGGATAPISTPHDVSPMARQCTGVYLPWSSGSEASLYGKGSNAQRTTICEQDLTALGTLLPGYAVSQYTQPYGPGVHSGEIMPDQVAEMGPGMKADTPVLNPWQYEVKAHGQTTILDIEYSRDTNALELCGKYNAHTPLASGFTLVDVITDPSTRSPAGAELKTPSGEEVVIYLSALTRNPVSPVDPVKLVESPGFTAMLAADLAIIGDN